MNTFLLAIMSSFLLVTHIYAFDADEDEDTLDDIEENEYQIDEREPIHCYRSTKLNLANFFTEKTYSKKPSQRKIFYNLLRILYGDQPIFSDKGDPEAIVTLFQKAEEKALNRADTDPITSVQKLCTLDLGPGEYTGGLSADRIAFYHIIIGGSGYLPMSGKLCRLEPLWSYVNLNPHSPKTVSVYLAPRNLLLAVFCNETIVDKIIERREAIWETLKTKTYIPKLSIEQDFKKTFSQYVQEGIDISLLDFAIYMTPPKRKPFRPYLKESYENFYFWHQ